MKKLISHRLQRLEPSATLALSMRTEALRLTGKDMINLSVGEPDFNTPEHIKEAAIQAIRDNRTHYTPTDGTPSLKKAIQHKYLYEHKLEYSTQQIIVSCGAKHALYNLFQCYLNARNEVIIPAPYWVSYPAMVRLANGTPVFIPTSIKQHYKITPAQLEAAITPKTRAVVINSPCNPSGAIYSKTELRALADIMIQHPNILVISDNIYEHIALTDTPVYNILSIAPELYDQTVMIDGVSKSYAMTGWRIGYTAGPSGLMQAMRKLQTQSTSNPCSIAQAAAEAALLGKQTCIKKMVSAFRKRHQYVLGRLQAIQGIQVIPSEGTFYIFPNVEKLIARIPEVNTDMELAEFLINEANVALVPGTAFGCPNSMRLSFAAHLNVLEKAMDRIAAACA